MNKQELINVRLSEDGEHLIILDQTRLPNYVEYREIRTAEESWEAIKSLKVRGAPCIGIFAAYSLYILAKEYTESDFASFYAHLEKDSDYICSARPTAVNLSWALNRVKKMVAENADKSCREIVTMMKEEAIAIHEEDIEMNRKISEYGYSLLKPGYGVLTHCNAGPIATSKYGTAQGPLILAGERGLDIHVFADETRPLLQGARLTSLELYNAGTDVTLICDNMASLVMKQGKVNICFVGCDRIAANGDFANKIGTSGVAVLAHYYGIPVYSLGPSSTIDMDCPDGDHINIELREPDEIKTKFYAEPMAPEGVKCYNPSFDVTDHTLLAGIVTEKGIVRPPFDVNLKKMFGKE